MIYIYIYMYTINCDNNMFSMSMRGILVYQRLM